jgi:hypothetical protein
VIGSTRKERRRHPVVPRTLAIVKQAEGVPPGPISNELRVRLHDPLLVTALHTAGAVVQGIVLLMTNKPQLRGATTAMVVLVLLGRASATPYTA